MARNYLQTPMSPWIPRSTATSVSAEGRGTSTLLASHSFSSCEYNTVPPSLYTTPTLAHTHPHSHSVPYLPPYVHTHATHITHPHTPTSLSVIYRLLTILSRYATLEASHSAALSQARSASAELQRRIDQEQQQGGGGEEEGRKKVRTTIQFGICALMMSRNTKTV